MKLTKIGKRVFTIYNIIISIIAYLLASNLGSFSSSNIITGVLIILYFRIFLSIIWIDLINSWLYLEYIVL